jgi:hypothetical protein
MIQDLKENHHIRANKAWISQNKIVKSSQLHKEHYKKLIQNKDQINQNNIRKDKQNKRNLILKKKRMYLINIKTYNTNIHIMKLKILLNT